MEPRDVTFYHAGGQQAPFHQLKLEEETADGGQQVRASQKFQPQCPRQQIHYLAQENSSSYVAYNSNTNSLR